MDMKPSLISGLMIGTFFSFAASFGGSAVGSDLRQQIGTAACYSHRLVGHKTTSGQRYDPNALTAAHGRYPLGTHVKVTNLQNGKSVVVVINDHMARHGRIIMDISQRGCKELEFPSGGEAKVKLEPESGTEAAASH